MHRQSIRIAAAIALMTGLAGLQGQNPKPSALEQFRNDCGLKKIARCGFPWEKTTKGLSLRSTPIAKLL